MAVIVVGGSGRRVGKTALVCGLVAALPEIAFAAVKITTHEHGQRDAIWEDFAAGRMVKMGKGTDTERYLAAGAKRALLVAAAEDQLGERLGDVWAELGPDANVIFESNRAAKFLTAGLLLGVVRGGEVGEQTPVKQSFAPFMHRADALVVRAEAGRPLERELSASKPLFRLADLERVSPEMVHWVRSRLRS